MATGPTCGQPASLPGVASATPFAATGFPQAISGAGADGADGAVTDDEGTERDKEIDMEMYVFHYSAFVVQLLLGLVVVLVAVELWRLNSPRARPRYRRNHRPLLR